MSDAIELDDLLLAHAAGTLPAPLALLVRWHLRLRPESRKWLRVYEQVGALCLERLEPLPMDPARRRLLLDRLASEPDLAASAMDPPPAAPCWDGLPVALDRLDWRLQAVGVAEAPLPALSDRTLETRLLRLDPGCSPGRHGHPAREFVLVLAGAFRDEYGCYRTGDVVICDQRIEHAPVAEGAEPCLCLEVRERSTVAAD
jgi:putative transcriptional regulator